MPDDIVIAMKLDARSAVLALSQNPRRDDLGLMEALRTPAFYVGAIGSIRNHRNRLGRLKLFDLTDQDVARLRGPVGLHIGAQTPAEISIAILAESVAARRRIDVLGAPRTVAYGRHQLDTCDLA
jgi:xanthine dehydrogenase accessory factor